jgi:hypothetical protein
MKNNHLNIVLAVIAFTILIFVASQAVALLSHTLNGEKGKAGGSSQVATKAGNRSFPVTDYTARADSKTPEVDGKNCFFSTDGGTKHVRSTGTLDKHGDKSFGRDFLRSKETEEIYRKNNPETTNDFGLFDPRGSNLLNKVSPTFFQNGEGEKGGFPFSGSCGSSFLARRSDTNFFETGGKGKAEPLLSGNHFWNLGATAGVDVGMCITEGSGTDLNAIGTPSEEIGLSEGANVPLPGSVLLFGSGLVGLAILKKKSGMGRSGRSYR